MQLCGSVVQHYHKLDWRMRILDVVLVGVVISPLWLVLLPAAEASNSRPILRMTGGFDAAVTGRIASPSDSGTLLFLELPQNFSLHVPELELYTPEEEDGTTPLVVTRYRQLYTTGTDDTNNNSFMGSGVDTRGRPVSVNIVETLLQQQLQPQQRVWNGYVLYRDTHYTIGGVVDGDGRRMWVERQSALDYPDEEAAIEEDAGDSRRYLRETSMMRSRQRRLDPSTGNPVVTVLIVFPRDVGCRIATHGRTIDCDTTSPLVNTVLEGIAHLVVNLANMAYVNSDIDLRMELVGFRIVDEFQANYTVSMRQLNQFKFGRSFLPLRRERDTLDADFVSLISDFPGSCGLAFIGAGYAFQTGDRAYSLINYQCIPNHSFTHEVAHTMGCLHNAENTPFRYRGGYSHGFRSQEHRFRTIMAYSCEDGASCPRVAQFSNPGITYNGVPTGSDQADNARWINENHWLYPTYRQDCETDTWMGLFCEVYRLVRQFLDFLMSHFWV